MAVPHDTRQQSKLCNRTKAMVLKSDQSQMKYLASHCTQCAPTYKLNTTS